MTRKSLILGFAGVWAAGWVLSAPAVEIARWNSTNAVQMAGTFAPTSQHANVTVSNLVAGPGLLLSGGSPAANVFAAGGYSAASSNAAMASNHYWQTVIQANPGYAISFDTVSTRFRSSGSGPKTAQWAYSTNGTAFTWLLPTNAVIDSYANDKNVSLSGISLLQNATGKIWFRMYAWGGGGANNAWGAFGRYDVLVFDGTVGSSGPVPPTVAFTPPGPQTNAVSNTLTLAVSITPAGSGMESWSLTPSFVGGTNFTGGTFQMTPYAGDSGKTFTLRVVATNTEGRSTGTVTIAVTAYVPPKPVITFSPAAPYSVMATQTQKLGIAMTPAGSVIEGWTLLPSNYAGSATLVGTNFTFATAQADGPSNYVLSIIATNVHGISTGTATLAVTTYVPPPAPGSYTASFEDTNKTGYASLDIVLSNKTWNLTGILIGTDATNDLKIGAKSARLKFDPTDGEETMTVQSKVMSNGVGTISMWYGPYGTHGTNAPTLAVEISDDLASGWVEVGEAAAGAVEVLTYFSADVFVSEPVYVRIRAKSGVKDKSANFDNVTITPFSVPVPDPYEAFLLQYNVTPGDPGTARGENLDGDWATNQEEFDASPQTNPYDEAIYPPPP